MKRALTLIELIVTIVILGVISGMGTEIIRIAYKEKLKSELIVHMQNEARGAVYTVVSALRTSVRESARLRQPVLSALNGTISVSNCAQGGCKYLYNLEQDLVSGTTPADFKTLEVALYDRPYGRYMSTVNEAACMVNLINHLGSWYGGNVGADGKFADNSTPCFKPLGNDKYNFRCFAISLPKRVNIYNPTSAVSALKNCNERMLDKRYLGPDAYEFADADMIEAKDPQITAAAKNGPIFGPWYGLYFKGDQIANTSTFLERDVYPAQAVFEGSNILEKESFKQNWSHWNVYIDLAEKNFAISNSFELITGMQYFELVKPFKPKEFYNGGTGAGAFSLQICTHAPCTLLAAQISYDAYIKNEPVATNLPYGALSPSAVDLSQRIFQYEVPHVLAKGVSKFKITDHNGVRMVELCLKRKFPGGGVFAVESDLEVCRSEVI